MRTKVTSENAHPQRLRHPMGVTPLELLRQSPHPQSMSCQRTPLAPSMSKSSSPPSPPSHPSPHLCSWIPEQWDVHKLEFHAETPTQNHPTPPTCPHAQCRWLYK